MVAATKPKSTKKRPAEDAYGYPFGVDGVVNREAALTLLSCSKATLYRLCSAGKVRRGLMGNRAKFCRRSIENHLRSIEA